MRRDHRFCGAVVEQGALTEELFSGRLHAVLDVFEEEPFPSDSILWTLPNVILMLRNSFISDGDANRLTALILQNLETLH